MTSDKEYRGYTRPRVYGGSVESPYSWTINDGSFGYFTGTKESVMATWERHVDKRIRRDAIYEGNYETVYSDDDGLSCPRCGGLVVNPETHTAWHQAIEGAGSNEQ